MKSYIYIISFFLIGFNQAYAIPPPDFIIQAVSNIGIYFAMGVAFLTAVFGSFFVYIKVFYRRNKILSVGIIIFILLGSALTIYLYQYRGSNEIIKISSQEKNSIQEWLQYKDEESFNHYKNLSYKEIVKKLINEERIKMEKWLFDNKKNTFQGEKISNKNLEKIINTGNKNFKILDAREPLEYTTGNIPGSIHYKVADLKLEKKWKTLDKTKTYIVICWGGMRGKLISEFLKSKNIKTRYLESGFKSWVKYGGKYNGTTKLSDVYKKSHYNKYINQVNMYTYMVNGTKIIDVRNQEKLKKEDIIAGATRIETIYITTKQLQQALQVYKKGEKLIIVCNDYVNCFDAQLMGIESEKNGINLIGLYIKEGIMK